MGWFGNQLLLKNYTWSTRYKISKMINIVVPQLNGQI